MRSEDGMNATTNRANTKLEKDAQEVTRAATPFRAALLLDLDQVSEEKVKFARQPGKN